MGCCFIIPCLYKWLFLVKMTLFTPKAYLMWGCPYSRNTLIQIEFGWASSSEVGTAKSDEELKQELKRILREYE